MLSILIEGGASRPTAMLVQISEIPDEGLRVDAPADVGAVFPDEGWSLDQVALFIERRGTDVLVTGRFGATARLQCSRCLESLVSRIGPEVDLHLVPAPTARQEQVELGPDDLEVDFYQGDTLDVARLLRSETDLALPMKPLCGPDCRGLCPSCGVNRNVTACRCEGPGSDPRLAPLEALRRRFPS
jgi:DUF177 domain-containing protein